MLALSPKALLVLFTLVNALTYYDRGALAVVLNNVEREVRASHLVLPRSGVQCGSDACARAQFNLSNTLGGLLGSSYMVGYVISAPIFAHLAHKLSPLRMMAGGLLGWCGLCPRAPSARRSPGRPRPRTR